MDDRSGGATRAYRDRQGKPLLIVFGLILLVTAPLSVFLGVVLS